MAKEKNKEKFEFSRFSLKAVDDLEKNAKVGFYVQQRRFVSDDPFNSELEPIVRLCCESRDPDKADFILTPFMSVPVLSNMVQGAMLLHPVLLKAVKDINSNAEKPEEK